MGDERLNAMCQKFAKLEPSDEENKNKQIVKFFNSASKFSGLSKSGALLAGPGLSANLLRNFTRFQGTLHF